MGFVADLPLFGFCVSCSRNVLMPYRQSVLLIQIEEKVIMANREQNPCNSIKFEGDEPQLGMPAQSSSSLPPPPPRTNVPHGCEEYR